MTPYQPDENTGFESLLHQRKLLSSLGNAGIPQEPMPAQPDLTVHVQHSVNGPPTAQPTPQVSAPSGLQSGPPQGQFDPNQEAALQTGVAPGPNAFPPKDPIPKVGPINPSMKNPMEAAYMQSLQNEPMHANYHPSGMRKFGAVMGGIGGAFASGGSLRAGLGIADKIENAPYDKQHSDWKQFAGNKGVQATEEAASNTADLKERLTNAQIREQDSLGSLHNKQANIIAPDMETDVNNKIDIAQGRLKVDTREVKMLDGTIKHVIQRNGLFFDPETHARVDRTAMLDISDEGKSLKDTKAQRIPANLQASIIARRYVAAGVGNKTEDGTLVDQPSYDAAKELIAKADRGDDLKKDDRFIEIEQKRAAGQPLTPDDESYAKAFRIFTDVTKVQPGLTRVMAGSGATSDRDARDKSFTAFQPAMESAERANIMSKNYEDAVQHNDQQAMLSLLANHLGMTMGLQKGARISQTILTEAEKSRPWLQGMVAKFDKDGYLSGVTLTPSQMKQMVDLGHQRFSEDAKRGKSSGAYFGVDKSPGMVPNKSVMRKYMHQANGDVNKAKQLAKDDNWSVE